SFDSRLEQIQVLLAMNLSLYKAVVYCVAMLFTVELCAQQAVYFTNARIIVGNGEVFEQATLYLDGDRITAVSEFAPDVIGNNEQIVDVTGKTIMPAMIDGHAHLGYQTHTTWHGDNYTRENLLDNLQQYAWYGFAAVFSAGSDADDLVLQIQSDQYAGRVDGARLLFAAGMAPPGQGPNNQFLVHTNSVAQRTGMTVLRGLASPQLAEQAADEVAAKGIDFIKIWVDDRNGSQQKLGPDVYRALMARASDHDIGVFVHQQFVSDMPSLLDAGVTGFLHGRLGDEFSREIAEATARRGAFIVPNLGLGELRREAIGDDPFLRAVMSAGAATRLAANGQRSRSPQYDADTERSLRASMARLLAAGVDIMLGTDAGGVADHPFGYTGHRELEIYVRLGLTPAQAIEAATSIAAKHLGLDDLGTLAEGNSADFIILSDNPLDDIRNTRSIEQVYLRGQAVNRDALARSWRNGDD
ncbi:MAG: amidohydrolase family protein, partial [Gammaproteobacteria bacterium]